MLAKTDKTILYTPNTWDPREILKYMASRLDLTPNPVNIPAMIALWEARFDKPIDASVETKLELYEAVANSKKVTSFLNHWPNMFYLADGLIDGVYDNTVYTIQPGILTATLILIADKHPDIESLISTETLKWVLAQYQYHNIYFLPITEPCMKPLVFINKAFGDEKINGGSAKFSRDEYTNFMHARATEQNIKETWQVYITLINIIHTFVTEGYYPIHDQSPQLLPDIKVIEDNQ